MFLFARRREGRATALLIQFLSFYLIFFRTISHAFPQRELPSSTTDTSIPESPTLSAGGPGGFSAHPNTAHVEQSATALGGATTAVSMFPSTGGAPPVETTAAPPGTTSVPKGPIVTPNIPHVESTVDGLDPSTTTVGTTGNPEQTEPEVIATPTCLSCDTEVTVTGLDFPTTPAAEITGNGNGTPLTQPPSPPATITAGSSAIQINQDSSGFLIGTQTVSAGQTISVQGTPIVIQTSNGQTQVIVGSSTVLFSPGPSAQGQITAAPLIIAGQTITANSAGSFTIGTQTLTPGGPAITVSGTTISLAPSGSIAVINGVTSTLAPGPAQATAKPGPPPLTLNGHTYTANSATQYVIGPGTTLTPGGAVTINGTVVSLSPSGTDIVVGGTTSLLGAGAATGTGVGAGATVRSTHSSAGAARARGMGTAGWTGWIEGLVGGIGVWVLAVFL